MQRREFLRRVGCGALGAALFSGFGWAATAQGQSEKAKKPNIIFILTDDQGWADAHFAGHPYVQTPNLDRLASQSTWFKQFYVASTVCSPSRCAFMTGHFPARHQIHGHFADHAINAARFMPDWLDPQVPTVTALLKQAGYATGHFGKWHLGGGDGAPTPDAYGIDDVRAMVCRNPAWTEPATPFWAKSSTALVESSTTRAPSPANLAPP